MHRPQVKVAGTPTQGMGKVAPLRPVRAHPHGWPPPDAGRRRRANRTIGAFGSRRDGERPMEPVMDARPGTRSVRAALAGAALGLGLVVATASAAAAQTTSTTRSGTTTAPTATAASTTAATAGAPLPPVNPQGTLAWHDATRSASLAIGVDPAQVVPTTPLRITFTWTFEGPTPLGTSGDSSNAATCESVLGRTYARTITDWRPVVYFGTSADVTAYRIGSNQLDGPWAAKATATDGEGHETVTPVRCDGATPIARTVRTYDVTYVTPDLPLARYALVTPDFGFPVWWQEGTPPILETVPPALGAPVPTTNGSTTTTAVGATTTTTAGASTTTAPGSTTTTAAPTTTTGPTSTTAAETTTTTTVAPAGPTGSGPGAGTGSGTKGDDPSALDQARALVGALASVLAVVGLLLAAWTLTPRAGRHAARRARRLLSAASLLALVTVGVSLFVAAFDAPMLLGGAALAVSALGALALRSRPRRTTLVGPGLSVADARRLLTDQ
jgi:hypothetical protein